MHKTLYLKHSVKQTVHYSSPCALGKHSKCSFTPGNASPCLVWQHCTRSTEASVQRLVVQLAFQEESGGAGLLAEEALFLALPAVG